MVDPERIEDTAQGVGDGPAPIDGLSADEQAQIDAMNRDGAAEVPAADAGADDPAGDADGDGDDGAPEPAETPVAADGDGQQQRQVPKTVSYGKHQRELAKAAKARDDLQARLDGAMNETKKEREERLRLDERTKLLLEAIQTKPKVAEVAAAPDPDDVEPNRDDDPVGYGVWAGNQLKKVRAEIEGIKTGQTKRDEATTAENAERQIYNRFSSDIESAARTDPTMAEAFVHLRETRYRELGFIYGNIDILDTAQCQTLSPEQQSQLSDNIQKAFYNEQMMVARSAIDAGRSPAQVVRNLAIARGYAPKAAAAAGGEVAVPTGGKAAPAARAAPAAPARSVGAELAAVRDNMAASKSLSDAGGSPGGDITPERLANMSNAEFEEFFDSMPKAKMDRLMGKSADA